MHVRLSICTHKHAAAYPRNYICKRTDNYRLTHPYGYKFTSVSLSVLISMSLSLSFCISAALYSRRMHNIVYVFVYLRVHECRYIFLRLYTYLNIYTCIHVHVNKYLFTCTHSCIHAYLWRLMCGRSHTCLFVIRPWYSFSPFFASQHSHEECGRGQDSDVERCFGASAHRRTNRLQMLAKPSKISLEPQRACPFRERASSRART